MADLLLLLEAAAKELLHGRLPPETILKPLISKGLGYGILAGSTLVKVPQLVAVVRARSADGLNPLSFELESVGLAIGMLYGFLNALPFSAFGEVVALFLQNCVLLLIVYAFQRRSPGRPAALLALLAGLGCAGASGTLSRAAAASLYDLNNLLLVASRLPQILQNQRSRGTGQLSLATYGLNTAGGAARIFTSIQEGAGPAMLRGAAIGTLLNGIIATQIVLFGGKRAKTKQS
eukprot:scaffold3.g6403.t1